MVKAGGGAPVAVFLLAPAGDGNEQKVLSSGHLAEPSGDLVAIHSRQTNVKHDDLRAFEYFRGIADAHAEEAPGTAQARFVANAFVALGNYYLEGIPGTAVKAYGPCRSGDSAFSVDAAITIQFGFEIASGGTIGSE